MVASAFIKLNKFLNFVCVKVQKRDERFLQGFGELCTVENL